MLFFIPCSPPPCYFFVDVSRFESLLFGFFPLQVFFKVIPLEKKLFFSFLSFLFSPPPPYQVFRIPLPRQWFLGKPCRSKRPLLVFFLPGVFFLILLWFHPSVLPSAFLISPSDEFGASLFCLKSLPKFCFFVCVLNTLTPLARFYPQPPTVAAPS